MTWRTEAEDAGRAAYPGEACGLVAVVRGRERFMPCRNVATEPGEHFSIHPEDWAAAEDAGEVVAVVHSHPGQGPDPSDMDRAGCEASGLPWHIVGVPCLLWRTIAPEGYRAPLVGREFAWRVQDCYSLIRDWFAEDRGVTLPDFPRARGDFERGVDHYGEHFAEAGFVEVHDEPRRGDVLLFRLAAKVPDHGAIYLGDDTILHHMEGRLSTRDTWGGVFRERTVKVLRYVA